MPNTTWMVAEQSRLCLIKTMGGLAEKVEAKVNASIGPCTPVNVSRHQPCNMASVKNAQCPCRPISR